MKYLLPCFVFRAAPLLGSVLLTATAQAQAPLITTFSPARNALAAPRTAAVALTFSQPLDAATASNVGVFSAQSGGRKAVSAAAAGPLLTLRPARAFRPGEVVSVSVPATVTSAAGVAAAPAVYQFTTATTPSAGTFATGIDVPVAAGGAGPVMLLDTDADGDLDLVTPSATRAVNLNNGRGSFTPTATSINYFSSYRCVADFNGDGNLDLLLADGNSYAIPLINNGSGGFVARPSLPGSNGHPSGVAVGDVDGDGDLDALVGTAYIGIPGPGAPPFDEVMVYLNQGTGYFATGYPVTVAYNIFAMALADLNNDGKLDLLATAGSVFNSNGTGIAVRFNDGTGHFSGGQNLSGSGPYSTVDVNGDGFLDLLVADNAAATVRVYLNNGNGAFGTSTAVLVGFGPQALAVADLDGDGDADLVTGNDANTGSYSLSIRLNDGQGNFSSGTDPSVPISPQTLALGDVDGDGDLDLALSNSSSGVVRLQLNSGTGAALAAASAALAAVPTLAPNPASGTATLRLPAGADRQPLALLDALGREVRRYPAPTGNEATLDLRGLAPGVYVLRSDTGSRRLVVE